MSERICIFRVWDKHKKIYFNSSNNNIAYLKTYLDYVDQSDHGAASFSILESDLVLLQYTGMVDTKEQKIWEGDVVEYSNSREGMKFNAEVVYDTKTARFKIISPKYQFDLYDMNDYYGHITVIGNIFQNPELLN